MNPGGSRLRDWWLLLRLHRPAGIWLLLWPTLWALWLVAAATPPLGLLAIFVLGTFLLRSIACVAEDLCDHLRYPGAERSRDRPIAQGRITPRQVLALLLALGLLLLILLTRLDRLALLLSLPGLALAAVLLLAANIRPLPQVQWSLACTSLYSGEADHDVPLRQSLLMRDALRKAGVLVQLKQLPGAGHGRMSPEAIAEALSFLDGVMKP